MELIGTKHSSTLPKTSMEPKNDPLGKGKTSTNHQFSGSMLVFRGVYDVIMSIYFFQIYTPIGSMYGNSLRSFHIKTRTTATCM